MLLKWVVLVELALPFRAAREEDCEPELVDVCADRVPTRLDGCAFGCGTGWVGGEGGPEEVGEGALGVEVLMLLDA